MDRASIIHRKGSWPGEASDSVTLDETARNRRRIRIVSDEGRAFLLDLPHATLLRDGDAIELDDATLIAVRAEPEDLYEVRAKDPEPQALLRLAWHIGNRHLPSQIMSDRILIRRDHVIRAMLEGLGATVTDIRAAFDPEGGAYGDGEGHPHHHDDHHHDHHHGQHHHHD